MILCWELSIISQKCFVQSVDMRVANVEISWTYPQITSSREATQPTRQHNGHSPWCRVSQFYKQVRCCPLPMSEKPQWYQNMEHLWIADLRSSNSSFQVTLSSHTILYLLRVLMFVSFFFTGLMTPRLVHILGQHAWNTKPLWHYDHWSARQSNPGTLELLTANFWWNYKSSWELRSRSSSWEPRFSCGKVGTCCGWNTQWSWCLSRLVSSGHDSEQVVTATLKNTILNYDAMSRRTISSKNCWQCLHIYYYLS